MPLIVNPKDYENREGTNIRLDKDVKNKIRKLIEDKKVPSICAYVNKVLREQLSKGED